MRRHKIEFKEMYKHCRSVVDMAEMQLCDQQGYFGNFIGVFLGSKCPYVLLLSIEEDYKYTYEKIMCSYYYIYVVHFVF